MHNPNYGWITPQNTWDDLTTPVNWTVLPAYDNSEDSLMKPPGNLVNMQNIGKAKKNWYKHGADNDVPGMAVGDQAFAMTSGFIGPDKLWELFPPDRPPEDKVAVPWDGPAASPVMGQGGAVVWQGTKAANMALLRSAMHTYGINLVGAVELDSERWGKFLKICDENSLVKSSVSTPYMDPEDPSKTIELPPNADDCYYLLTWVTKQDVELCRYSVPDGTNPIYGPLSTSPWENPTEDSPGPSQPEHPNRKFATSIGKEPYGIAYTYAGMAKYMTMKFIKTLGYWAVTDFCRANVALGILSGLGEQGRTSHLCTPEYGLGIRFTGYCLTNLPLEGTLPIDAGITEFCKTCKICAEICPYSAISVGGDFVPYADHNVGEGWGTRPGYDGWRHNWRRCKQWGSPANCGFCQAVCPFNQPILKNVDTVVRKKIAEGKDFDWVNDAHPDWVAWGTTRKTANDIDNWWDRGLWDERNDTLFGFGRDVW